MTQAVAQAQSVKWCSSRHANQRQKRTDCELPDIAKPGAAANWRIEKGVASGWPARLLWSSLGGRTLRPACSCESSHSPRASCSAILTPLPRTANPSLNTALALYLMSGLNTTVSGVIADNARLEVRDNARRFELHEVNA